MSGSTGTMPPTTKPPAEPAHQRTIGGFGPRWWRAPVVIVGILAVVVVGKALHTPKVDPQALADSAAAGARQGAAAVTTTAAPQVVLIRTGYDFLTCTHDLQGQPCDPLFLFPLTEGAKTMIKGERGEGAIAGELNTANTRTVYTQVRRLPRGTEDCALWIDTEMKVYVGAERAPQGAVKLLDCGMNPNTVTAGTIPSTGP